MNISYIYLLIDEIDHITIQYREQNKPLQRKNGIDKILYCLSAFDEVRTALAGSDTGRNALNALTDAELHDVLIMTRNALWQLL